MAFKGFTIAEWQTGMDVRRPASSAPASSFRELLNCHLTPGRTVRKRPGLRLAAAIAASPGTTAFSSRSIVAAADGLMWVAGMVPPMGNLLWIDQTAGAVWKQFNFTERTGVGWKGGVDAATGKTLEGAYYIAGDGATVPVQHIYQTPFPNVLSNPNATEPGWDAANFPGPVFTQPGFGMVSLAERIYATDGTLVRMSDVVDVRNWLPPTGTQTQLAGFLNVGLHQASGDRTPLALGRYRDRLVVFFANAAQVWTTDPDPALHRLDNVIDGVGCRWPRAVCNIAGDCIALDDSGFRAISIVDAFGNIADVDVGSAIDKLVTAAVASLPAVPGVEPCAIYAPARQQAMFAIGQDVFVLTFSRSTRLSAWSRYRMPAPVVWMEERNGEAWVRCRFMQAGVPPNGTPYESFDAVYVFDDTRYSDDIYDPATNTITRQPFQVRAELPFLDLGAPGSLKTLYGWDAVVDGTAEVFFRLDPANPAAATLPVQVSGDTRPGASLPLQGSAVAVQPVVEDFDDRPWELGGLTIYFESRGLR